MTTVSARPVLQLTGPLASTVPTSTTPYVHTLCTVLYIDWNWLVVIAKQMKLVLLSLPNIEKIEYFH
jgi:hypothetical protein